MVVARPLRDHARPSLVEPRITTILDDLEAKAVPFGFVQPIVALGWADVARDNQEIDAP